MLRSKAKTSEPQDSEAPLLSSSFWKKILKLKKSNNGRSPNGFRVYVDYNTKPKNQGTSVFFSGKSILISEYYVGVAKASHIALEPSLSREIARSISADLVRFKSPNQVPTVDPPEQIRFSVVQSIH